MNAIERELSRVACGRSPHADYGEPTQYTLSACGRVQAFIVIGGGGVSVWKLIDYRENHLAKSVLITGVAQLRELLASKGITQNAADTSQESRGAAAEINRRLGPAPGGNLP